MPLCELDIGQTILSPTLASAHSGHGPFPMTNSCPTKTGYRVARRAIVTYLRSPCQLQQRDTTVAKQKLRQVSSAL